MAEIVYILCAVTSAACAFLLIRGYLNSRSRVLLWSSVCFGGLAVTNSLLVVDLVMLPTQIDLAVLRASITLGSMLVLVFGLVWDAR